MENPPRNPHASAAGAYDQHAQSHTPDQRELEARVLLKSAKALQGLQSRWDQISGDELDEALTYNRQIWMMFVDHAIGDKSEERPQDLRNNIANLGAFIFNRTIDILANPEKEKLNVLVEINHEIAAGLMTKAPSADEKPE